jgi:hypothetical protein
LSKQQAGWTLNGDLLAASLADICQPAYRNDKRDFPWQQTLRAGYHHLKDGDLKTAILIGSREGSGTPEQLQLARDFFGDYFGVGNVPVRMIVPGLGGDERRTPDFENLTETYTALKLALDDAGRDDHDIIIDITAGQKTASVAATLVTLDREQVMFQYVGTGPHTGQLFGFNVSTESNLGV